jgi:hypothetical protein
MSHAPTKNDYRLTTGEDQLTDYIHTTLCEAGAQITEYNQWPRLARTSLRLYIDHRDKYAEWVRADRIYYWKFFANKLARSGDLKQTQIDVFMAELPYWTFDTNTLVNRTKWWLDREHWYKGGFESVWNERFGERFFNGKRTTPITPAQTKE